MTIKQKFSSIDQSKLTADQKSFLEKIKNVTKDFTDSEMNKKVEAPLDNFIAKAKEKMPEAIKSAPAKRTSKATPSQTKKPKRTPMSLAKEIRKEGESWSDARARASKIMKEDSKDLSKTVESELDKLTKLVRSQKDKSKLAGISGTDIKRDSVRKAKPRGARTVTHSGETSNQYGTFNNKLGRKYYESRDRHSDRLAPNYPKNAPLLENGAYLTDPTFGTFQNQVLAEGGDIDAFTLRMVKSNGMQPAEVLKEDANVKYAGGGFFSTGRPKSALMRDRKNVNHSEDYEVRYSKPRLSRTGYSGNRRFELGGTMATDLAGHTGGGDAGLNAGMPLNGFSNTGYTGLVGETGAMSSGEMFMNGGGLPSGAEQSYMVTEALGNPAQHFNKGGSVTNERKHVNHNEDYEVRYAKPRPHRTGYEGKRNFATGGTIPNNYEGKSADEVWKDWSYDQKYHFLSDHREKIGFEEDLYNESKRTTKQKKSSMGSDVGFMYLDIDKIVNTKYTELPKYVKFALLDHVRTGQYNKGGAVTNERKHVNHDEDYEVRYAKPRPSRKGYKGARKFMAGGSMETPRIYVADLEAYNNGRLAGEWLDLADYNDADELMDAIQDVLKKSGGEEYAIHDVEYVPRSMYSEYMGKRDFEELYEMMDLAKQNDLPLEVVQEIVSQFSESAVDDFYGKFDSVVDFAEQLVDELGIESFNDFEYYLDISETDRRLLSQEMADSYVEDIRDEDGGNRLIEEAGLNVDEYEDASDESKEEMLDLASSMVNDEYYDTWYEGLNDPKGFLVDEQGLYSVEDFAKANFVRVDYDRLADALEQDYTFIEHDGDVYVFNIR
jgi:antirestriction protein